MQIVYVIIGALIALVPMASFVLIALETVMVFQIAKKHGVFHLGDLIWFCGIMVTLSFFLKFFASWLHLIPALGQISNSLVAGLFIYFVYEVADSHYANLAKK